MVKYLEQKREENDRLQKHIISKLRRATRDFPVKFPTLARLMMAGSIVNGNFSSKSDVDIVVSGLAKNEYFSFYNYLENILKRKIDLILEEDISEKDRKHILRKKEIIYDRKKNRP